MAIDTSKHIKLLSAVVGGGALVALGVLGVATEAHPAVSGATAKSHMTVGATSTETTPSNAPQTAVAKPTIKGPAPLPSEEEAAR